MIRGFWLTTVGGICLSLVACAKEEDYLSVYRDQQKSWQEITDILGAVQDQKSMGEAQAKLDASIEKFETISKRANALPKPSKEIAKRLEREIEMMQLTTDNLKREVGRIRKLPGGQEFLKHFESKHQGLVGAVR